MALYKASLPGRLDNGCVSAELLACQCCSNQVDQDIAVYPRSYDVPGNRILAAKEVLLQHSKVSSRCCTTFVRRAIAQKPAYSDTDELVHRVAVVFALSSHSSCLCYPPWSAITHASWQLLTFIRRKKRCIS